ncbi:hypothetical protein CGLO_04809 [Colletotrichum gloeosporioides Cg-14]|uniref:Uncharacterized protein n=1 Tax=Colletotrichum gloeosporioides (strain Cg-14) TaxID=1237896 RepID=T0LU34_COLGC|nr:hypothetical protein CGLO_04809 [Colletotrichum gloeosporioides Cg-14]
MPESPVINNRSPKIGDLVSYEGGNTVASLGPILEFSGKRYFLVPADLFRGANFESSVPVGVKLVHPAGLDSPTGLTPKEIGVFSYWSGIPEAGIKSTQPGDYTESNWALCEVTYAPLLREDQSHIIRYQQSGNSSRRIPDILTQSPSSRNVVLGRRDTETKSFKVSEGPWFEPILTLGSKNIPPTKKWYIEYTLEPNSGSGRWTPREKNGAFLFDEEFGDLVGMVSGYENNDNDNRLRVYFTSIVDIFDNIQQKYPEIGRPIIFGGSSSAAKTEEEAFFKKIRSFIDRSSARESGEIGANAAQTHTSEEKNHENQSHDFDGDLNSDVFSSISSMFSGVESTTSYSSVQHSEAQALREVVATLFVEDEVILESFKNALTPEAAGATAMTVVLRNGLRDMGKALKVESKTSEQGLCARRIRRDAQFIADSVRRKCDPKFQAPQLDIEYIKLPMSQEEQRRHLMSMWLRSQSSPFEQAVEQSGYPSGSQMDYPTNMEEGPDTSDDEQIDPEAEQALNQKIQELKVFILESEHMQTLRHKLHIRGEFENCETFMKEWFDYRHGRRRLSSNSAINTEVHLPGDNRVHKINIEYLPDVVALSFKDIQRILYAVEDKTTPRTRQLAYKSTECQDVELQDGLENNYRDNDQDSISDTSDDSSSTTGSIFSDTGSASSNSSLPGLQAIALRQKLAEVFANEATIREIFSMGLNTESVGAESITTAFRRSLRTLGKELLATTASPEKRTCAKRMTLYARYIADFVRRVCDPAYESSRLRVDPTVMSAIEQRRHIANMLLKSPVAASPVAHRIAENHSDQRMDLSDSDGDSSDVDNDERLYLRIKDIEVFILKSEQFHTMNDRLHFYITRRVGYAVQYPMVHTVYLGLVYVAKNSMMTTLGLEPQS